MNKKFEAVPVADFKSPESWRNKDMDDPDFYQQEFFALGNHRAMTTIWCEDHLKDVTHVLVAVEEVDKWISPVTNVEIFKWLQSQNYQTEQGEQEYKMYFDVDMPKILEAYYDWKLKRQMSANDPDDEKVWSVFMEAYDKFRSKQIEDHYEPHKNKVIEILKKLLPSAPKQDKQK